MFWILFLLFYGLTQIVDQVQKQKYEKESYHDLRKEIFKH